MKLKWPFWRDESFMQASESLGFAAMHPSILRGVIRALRAILGVMLVMLLLNPVISRASQSTENLQWSLDRASTWASQKPWGLGFNYVPRYAINQLEMWQRATFDAEIIDQELGWAAEIGFNSVRVFLHHLLWQQDAEGFSQRIDEFLAIADSHSIDVMFVLFDDVWNPIPQLGRQPEPRAGVHNSGWVQSPGSAILGDLKRHDELEPYVRGILSAYRDDERVAVWDLYNEPGNRNGISYGFSELKDKQGYSLSLLKKVFAWARSEHPNQPLTAGVWRLNEGRWRGQQRNDPGAALFDFMLQHSDILSFHSYENAANTAKAIMALDAKGRPMLCTEYMARGYDSTFEALLPLFAEKNIGAMHWGFVSGKSQTIYPWRSWVSIIRVWDRLFADRPNPWHHDLLHADGRPYRPQEVQFIRTLIDLKLGQHRSGIRTNQKLGTEVLKDAVPR